MVWYGAIWLWYSARSMHGMDGLDGYRFYDDNALMNGLGICSSALGIGRESLSIFQDSDEKGVLGYLRRTACPGRARVICI